MCDLCSVKTLQDSYDSLAYFQHTNRGRLGGGATLGQSDDCSTLIGQSAVLWDEQQTAACWPDTQKGEASREPAGGAAAQAALACMGLTAASAGRRPVPIKLADAATVSCSEIDQVGHESKPDSQTARKRDPCCGPVSC